MMFHQKTFQFVIFLWKKRVNFSLLISADRNFCYSNFYDTLIQFIVLELNFANS